MPLRRLDEGAEALDERVGGRVHDRDSGPEGRLGAGDRLVVEEGDDRLPERHALDREDAVPACVQLVDDDVRVAVALERLVVAQALDQDEVGVEASAGGDDVLRAFACAR